MKLSDIKVNHVYTNGSTKRKVCKINRYDRYADDVTYRYVDGQNAGFFRRVTVRSFAHWAVEDSVEVEQ